MSKDNSLKIIHTADWHLSSSLSSLAADLRLRVKAAQKKALADLAELIKREEVKLLLLAGDIFDSATPDKDDVHLFCAFLDAVPGTQAVLVAGNHDPYFYASFWSSHTWPSNLHICSPQTEIIRYIASDISVRIVARSFSAYIEEAELHSEAVAIESLGLVCPETVYYTDEPFDFQDLPQFDIFLMHGDIKEGTSPSAYNPIYYQTPAYSRYDYLALGHVHKAALLKTATDTSVAYPGFFLGRGFDELGVGQVLMLTVSADAAGKATFDLSRHALPVWAFMRTETAHSERLPDESINACIERRIVEISSQLNIAPSNVAWQFSVVGMRNKDERRLNDFDIRLIKKSAACDYLHIMDHSQDAIDYELLSESQSLAGLIYKNYRQAKHRASADKEENAILDKALQYAMKAYNAEFREDELLANLELTNAYLEGLTHENN